MEALVTLLTRERALAELAVFKLVELRQVLMVGEVRFLPWASEEVERAMEALRTAELERAVLVAHLAAERGLPDEVRLIELVEDVAEPWRGLLDEIADDLRDLCEEAAHLVTAVRRLADSGMKGVTELLGRALPDSADDGLVLYGRSGRTESGAPAHRVAHTL